MRTRVAIEAAFLWFAFPALLAPAATSVLAAAAAGAVQERVDTVDAPAGLGYVVALWFLFVVFASMVINLVVTIAIWPTAPDRGMPWLAGLMQMALVAVLAGWASHFLWQARYEATPMRVVPAPFEELAAMAPVLCMVLSIGSLAAIVSRQRGARQTSGTTLIRPARAWILGYFSAAAIALLVRFLLPLDTTGQNAANWALVVLGAPISVLAAPVSWALSPIAFGRLGDGAASLAGAVLFSLPIVVNVSLGILALRSPSFRERWAPAIALE